MAAPTNAANVKKALANSEPSTHGTKLPIAALRSSRQILRVERTCHGRRGTAESDPHWSLVGLFCCTAQHSCCRRYAKVGRPARREDEDHEATRVHCAPRRHGSRMADGRTRATAGETAAHRLSGPCVRAYRR